MTTTPDPIARRAWLAGCASCALTGALAVVPRRGRAADAAASAAAERALRLADAGVVVMMRHALAPGTFDPPGFRLDDCSTQRNLSDEGRAQARRIGAWFRERGLVPERVRSSPWCRCVDTATLAFGRFEPWPLLVSGLRDPAAPTARNASGLADELADRASRRVAGFDVWVTHQVVMTALTGRGASSGEALVLRAGANGGVEVLASLAIP